MNLVGTWALFIAIHSVAEVPMVGDVENITENEVLLKITESNGRYLVEQDTCNTRIVGGSRMVHTTLPPAFISSLPDRVFFANFDVTGRFHADAGEQIFGWTGEGELPTSVDDPRIRDDDGDGKPGVTVSVYTKLLGKGEVYIVQRGHIQYNGRQIDENRIEGSVDILRMEQHTLQASRRMLHSTLKVRPQPSQFVMTKIENELDCSNAFNGRTPELRPKRELR